MEDWVTKPLASILSVQNGYAFKSSLFGDRGMPLIRIRDIANGYETQTRYDGDYDNRYVVRAGDFLIGMDGEFKCYEWRGPDALLNQRVCKLTNFSPDIDPRFVLYGINKHLKDIEDHTGFTTVKHLSSKQILNIEFSYPALPVQQRIVAILDEAFEGIDRSIANTEKNLANARELFESYLELKFEDHRSNCSNFRLAEIVERLTNGYVGPTRNIYLEEGVPYLLARHVKNNRLDFDGKTFISQEFNEKNKKSILKCGDVLLVPIPATSGR